MRHCAIRWTSAVVLIVPMALQAPVLLGVTATCDMARQPCRDSMCLYHQRGTAPGQDDCMTAGRDGDQAGQVGSAVCSCHADRQVPTFARQKFLAGSPAVAWPTQRAAACPDRLPDTYRSCTPALHSPPPRPLSV